MQISRRSMMFGLAASSACLALPVFAKNQVLAGEAFGSTWRLVIEDVSKANIARSIVEKVVTEVDGEMSPYKASSALSLFNAAQTNDWQAMPEATCTVVGEALRIATLSGGAFDPTVGPTVGLFGFGPIKGGLGRPSDLTVSKHKIRKHTPDLTLDLCGIAKGYALDRVAKDLADSGFDNALIEIGGEVLVLGQHPNGRAWQVGITNPMSDIFDIQRIVEPAGQALATSGHAANGVSGPISTSHIIDPSTGRPTKTDLASVSVLAPTAMEADALATALCAAGVEKGVTLAERLGTSALFITDGAGTQAEIITGSFETHIVA